MLFSVTKDPGKLRANGPRRMALTTLSIEDFLRKLGSADPTPGGGSVAAAVGAFGASLVRMVASLTLNSPKFADSAARSREIEHVATKLSEKFQRLVNEDAESFDRVSAAYRLPKTTAAEKAARSAAIQSALVGAIGPPAKVIKYSREVCVLTAQLADIGNPNALSDVGCAALCGQAAARCANLNVEINAGALKDRAFAQSRLDQAAADIAQVNLLCEVILGKLRSTGKQ
jgi:formiminotetrahydrofolate cyclodeaminase